MKLQKTYDFPWHRAMDGMKQMLAENRRIIIPLRRVEWAANILASPYYYGMFFANRGSEVPANIDLIFDGQPVCFGCKVDAMQDLRCTRLRVSADPFNHLYHCIQAVFSEARYTFDPVTQTPVLEVVR